MTRFKKFGAIFFISAYLLIGGALIVPRASFAALDPVKFTPQIGIPGSTDFQQGVGTVIGTATDTENLITGQMERVMRSDLLARYIAAFYNWGLYIVGALAVLMLMAAGLIWLTSMGDPGKIGQAKKMIGGSIMGTALLVGAWFFLNTINPDLTKLPSIDATIIIPSVYGCCQLQGKAIMSSQKDCGDQKGVFNADTMADTASNTCKATTCCFYDNSQSGANDKYCNDEIAEKCTGKKIAGSCQSAPGCQGIISSCQDVLNGRECLNENSSQAINARCYFGKCYSGPAGLGEYCGNNEDIGGVCVKSTDECTETDLGGRECVGGNSGNLKCCHTKTTAATRCKGESDGTSCQLVSNGGNGTGFCFNDVCTKCTDSLSIMSTGFPGRCKHDYQCKNTAGFCGVSFSGGICTTMGFCSGTVNKGADKTVYEDGKTCESNAIGDLCASNHCCAGLCCAYNSSGGDIICLPGSQKGASGAGQKDEKGPNACSAGLYTIY